MTTTGLTNDVSLDVVADLAAQLRVDSIRSSTSAGSGHPTSSMSAADLLAVLVGRHLFSKSRCPASRAWPWKLQVGFPEGTRSLTGSVGCR